MTTTREQRVLDTFVVLADTLTGDYDVGEVLHLLVGRCAEVLDVTTGGVLVEAPDGSLTLAAATSPEMRDLEQLEMTQGEGPCLEAYQEGKQVIAEDLHEHTSRWPRMAPKALAMGLVAVYAFPLRRRDDCIGALNLYRDSPGAFRADDVRLAQAFADAAAIGILQERRLSSRQQRADQLQAALDGRVLIEQAKGVVAERYGVSPREAFERIRRHARDRNLKVRGLCERILAGEDPLRG